jgi:hypothetical protein
VALRPRWRRARGCRLASSPLKGGSPNTTYGFGPCPHDLRRVADDGSRWRSPARPHGFNCRGTEWSRRLACDAHHCIMVRVSGPPHTRMWTKFVHHTRASLERRHSDTLKRAVVLEAFKDEPSVGANARPSLTRFCAHRRCGCVGRDEETAAGSNKETDGQENGQDPCSTPLTISVPYKPTWLSGAGHGERCIAGSTGRADGHSDL